MGRIAIVSGGFDPIHVGHISLLKDSLNIAEYVWVILNNDNWLMNKKGYVFMPEKERKEILLSMKWVRAVTISNHRKNCKDMSVVKDLNYLLSEVKHKARTEKELLGWGSVPTLFFCNGGDRGPENTPEVDFCLKNNIKVVYNVGGQKVQSSSELVRVAIG